MKHDNLRALIDPRASSRRRALDELAHDSEPAAYVLRSALLLDRDATVRACAAQRLGTLAAARRRAGEPIPDRFRAWLESAAADAAPTVREAAYRSLARVRAPASLLRLCRACAREPVWSVRRAAVIALASLAGELRRPGPERDDQPDVRPGAWPEVWLNALLGALDDPFWRVRFAAARALCVLGAADAGLREWVLASEPSTEWAQAALAYVRRSWSDEMLPVLEPAPRPEPVRLADAGVDPVWDADPAVMTARFERREFEPSRALLLEAIADSHEPLRKLAVERLRASRDMVAIRAALAWLDEPRMPHAGDSVYAILAALGDQARALAAEILCDEGQGQGATVWALSWIADTECTELAHLVAARVGSGQATVRAAAAQALGRLSVSAHIRRVHDDPSSALGEAVAALRRMLGDDDDRVRLAAVCALGQIHREDAARALARLDVLAQPAAVQRMMVTAALGRGASPAHEALFAGLAETIGAHGVAGTLEVVDAWAAAEFLAAMDERGVLSLELRRAASASPDPWLRGAVMDVARALAVFRAGAETDADADGDTGAGAEPDPQLRRAALVLLAEHANSGAYTDAQRQRVALSAAREPDAWLRAHACRLLAPAGAGELEALLTLLADRQPMVRAAASERLRGCADCDGLIRALLADAQAAGDGLDPHGDRVRSSAYTWLAREFDDSAGQLLVRALESGAESPAVAAHLAAMLIALPEVAERAGLDLESYRPRRRIDSGNQWPPPRASQPAGEPGADIARRALGRTDILVSPLVVSGAYELSVDSLRAARRAGVDTFFWEPRYRTMARFLAEPDCPRERLVVVTGSFHGSPRAVEADVDRALRRLRTDYLDVFLLFWVRSPARITDEMRSCMRRLVDAGKIRATGLSTHDRALAAQAAGSRDWDVLMVRHSAAHRGAEHEVLPAARAADAGVLTFSALSYGQMLRPAPGSHVESARAPSAADCYRYSLSQPGVAACISAPRRHGELMDNLGLLARPTLEPDDMAALRAHGDQVYRRSKDFNALIRREPRADWLAREQVAGALEQLFDEVAPPAYF